MARRPRDSQISSREPRLKLKLLKRPYWKQITPRLFIGYRRTESNGTWVLRRFTESGKYTEAGLGAVADDYMDSDGEGILSFSEAVKRAITLEEARKTAVRATVSEITVAQVMSGYLEWVRIHRKSARKVESSIASHILPTFGTLRVSELSTQAIRIWHQQLASKPAILRSGFAKPKKVRIASAADPDALRRRKATANRVLTYLKAALNRAYQEGLASDDGAWKRVKPFRGVDKPEVRFLTVAEAKRLIRACAPDFRRIVEAALLTGCRYSELTGLVCADYKSVSRTLILKNTKSNKTRHVYLTAEGVRFFDSVTAGRAKTDQIFLTSVGTPWGVNYQCRPLAAACKKGKIAPAISFHILRHTYGSLLAQKGVPLQVVAEALGHADTRLTQRHYAHLQPSYIADTIRANLPEFDLVIESKVVSIAGGRRR